MDDMAMPSGPSIDMETPLGWHMDLGCHIICYVAIEQ